MNYQQWKKYESPERWTSYFMQVDEVLAFNPRTCLEIGVGNGIVSHALRGQGINVTTLDIDPSLMPDMVGSVTAISAADRQFDVVLCAEVLEHLPFEQFEQSMFQIARVTRCGAVLSLPHWGYTIRAIVDIPGIPKLRTAKKLPVSIMHRVDGEHFWEIGKKGFPSSRIRNIVKKYFFIEREFLSSWMPYHRFYRLRPLS